MRRFGEVFQKAPDGADRKSSAETPKHRLNDDGTLKFVRFFGDVEAHYGKRANKRQGREYGEEIDEEASGMKMVKCSLGDKEKDNVNNHRG
jgi:hypothetical protein